ncbi:predicted protein [Brucella abortus bv. 3 str. Tulya]|nr:predicted protein [Brucella abortus bv. 3 str. Tulya]
MHTSKRFDKGGLSRAVIADKGDDFAGKDFQIDIGQCRNSAFLDIPLRRSTGCDDVAAAL